MRIALAVTCSLAMACTSSLSHPTYVQQASSALVQVDQPPPPARVEILPPRPTPLSLWVDGEWVWRRRRWAWLSGRWVTPPAGAVFSPWVVVRGTDGKLWYAPGVWRDATGASIVGPPALALASVEAGAIVDADGATETTGPILHDRPRAEPSPEGAPSKGGVGSVNP